MNNEKCQELNDDELIILYKELDSFIKNISEEIEKVSDKND